MRTDTYAPICLFTYNRLEETKKTVEALQLNNLASKSELYVFSDGWKNDEGEKKIKTVRDYLKTVTGFKSVIIKEATTNKGLATSIIDGVTEVLQSYENVIVLEDDLITAPNFLDFMNQSLSFYKDNLSVFSISGYTMNLPSLKKENKDYYFAYRASSWGWGTWKRSWVDIDWDIKNYQEIFTSKAAQKKLNKGGSDMYRMLQNQLNKKIDSWAIRWCYNQSIRNQYTVYPVKSKVISIGFGENATHTKTTKRFDTELDKSNKIRFSFNNTIDPNKTLLREFKFKFSILKRILDRL